MCFVSVTEKPEINIQLPKNDGCVFYGRVLHIKLPSTEEENILVMGAVISATLVLALISVAVVVDLSAVAVAAISVAVVVAHHLYVLGMDFD